VAPHFRFRLVQACVAILLLVGFESVTAMGEEAKNPKKDIGRAVLLSLAIQGRVLLPVRVFRGELLPEQRLHLSNAGASGAPLGDMMVLVGTWAVWQLFGGRAFMLVEAFTVFLALIGTTLSCMNTGARVTYAMGRDEEVPVAIRHVARQDPLAAPRHLVPVVHLDLHRHHDDHVIYLGGQSSDGAAGQA
jgi:basic amino acid/polyamine antiporter, APA family